MHPDLIARTCGFIGVLGALVFMGILDTPTFIVTPSQNFESVLLSINVSSPQEELKDENQPNKESEPVKDNELNKTKPEPIEPPKTASEPNKIEPAPIEQPKVEQPIVEEKPTEVVKVEKPKPIEKAPAVKAEPKKELPKPKEQVKPPHKPKEQANKTKEQSNKSKEQAKSNNKASSTSSAPITNTQLAKELETASRKLNAQLASLLVKEIKSKLRYPRNAVRRKLEGTVMVEFVIQNGVVTSYKIEKSSGHKILDEAAGKLAKSLIKFNTRLDAMSNRVLIPIKYELL